MILTLLFLGVFVAGIVLLAYSIYESAIVYPAQYEKVHTEWNSTLATYLDTHNLKFAGDDKLSASQRIDILTTTHGINAEQLGEIQTISDKYHKDLNDLQYEANVKGILFLPGAFMTFFGTYIGLGALSGRIYD